MKSAAACVLSFCLLLGATKDDLVASDEWIFPARSFEVGDTPRVIINGDLNGDGIIDLATLNGSSYSVSFSISVLIGRGDGTFDSQPEIHIPENVRSLSSGDINGDGISELLFLVPEADEIVALFGDGQNWTEVRTSVGDFPKVMTVGDFDGDGIDDVAVGSDYSADLSVLLGTAAGDLNLGRIIPLPIWQGRQILAVEIFAHDLDNDGKLDIAGLFAPEFPFDRGQLGVIFQTGDVFFSYERLAGGVGLSDNINNVAVGDVNGDGLGDLVYTVDEFASRGTYIFVGRPNRSFEKQDICEWNSSNFNIVIAELNGDEFDDTIFIRSTYEQLPIGFVEVYLGGLGSPCKNLAGTFDLGQFGRITFNDFDGDGFSDAALANGLSDVVAIAIGRGDGEFRWPQTTLPFSVSSGTYQSLTTGDIDGDGVADFAASRQRILPFGYDIEESLISFKVDENGPHRLNSIESFDVSNLALGDFDGDGKADLVSNQLESGVSVSIGNGKGAFSPPIPFDVPVGSGGINIGDVNGDGFIDTVISHESSESVSVVLNDGSGAAFSIRTFSVGEQPNAIAIADVNSDQKVDVIVANQGSQDVSMLIGDGVGGFSTEQRLNVGESPARLEVADLDGDGNLDLVTSSRQTREVVYLRGFGDGTFSSADRIQSARRDQVVEDVKVADVDGDGVNDIVTANSRSLAILFGQGDGEFDSPRHFAAGDGEAVELEIQDFDGDGLLDIVMSHDTAAYSRQYSSISLFINQLGEANVSVIFPDSLVVTSGNIVEGGIQEISASDNFDLSINRPRVSLDNQLTFEVTSRSSVSNPTVFEVELEGAVFTRRAVAQTIELFNYHTQNWELVSTASASRFNDQSVTVQPSGDFARFVEDGTNEIKARVNYIGTRPKQKFRSHTDLFQWRIGQ